VGEAERHGHGRMVSLRYRQPCARAVILRIAASLFLARCASTRGLSRLREV
jgi:hypothetical protein